MTWDWGRLPRNSFGACLCLMNGICWIQETPRCIMCWLFQLLICWKAQRFCSIMVMTPMYSTYVFTNHVNGTYCTYVSTFFEKWHLLFSSLRSFAEFLVVIFKCLKVLERFLRRCHYLPSTSQYPPRTPQDLSILTLYGIPMLWTWISAWANPELCHCLNAVDGLSRL